MSPIEFQHPFAVAPGELVRRLRLDIISRQWSRQLEPSQICRCGEMPVNYGEVLNSGPQKPGHPGLGRHAEDSRVDFGLRGLKNHHPRAAARRPAVQDRRDDIGVRALHGLMHEDFTTRHVLGDRRDAPFDHHPVDTMGRLLDSGTPLCRIRQGHCGGRGTALAPTAAVSSRVSMSLTASSAKCCRKAPASSLSLKMSQQR